MRFFSMAVSIGHTFLACPGVFDAADFRNMDPKLKKKAGPSDYRTWYNKQSDETKQQIHSLDNGSRWGVEIDRNKYAKLFFGKDGADVDVEIKNPLGKVVCLDPSSPFAGNMYTNESKLAIYTKLWLTLIVRPIHIVAHTLYHLLLIKTAIIIFKGMQDNKPAEVICAKVIRSLADVIRTPIYGIALIVVTVAGLVFSLIYWPLVYEIRAVIARLTLELYWGKEIPMEQIYLAPCMQPTGNLADHPKV